jgi:hypothetical protein
MAKRQTVVGVLACAGAAGLMSVIGLATQAQTSSSKTDALLEWPLPPGEQAYARIDGKHLHQYVEEQAAISRRYRDQGHPKFWGRIIGSSADAESADGSPRSSSHSGWPTFASSRWSSARSGSRSSGR